MRKKSRNERKTYKQQRWENCPHEIFHARDFAHEGLEKEENLARRNSREKYRNILSDIIDCAVLERRLLSAEQSEDDLDHLLVVIWSQDRAAGIDCFWDVTQNLQNLDWRNEK